MTTVTELKELFIKLGGDPEKVKGLQTDAEVIDLLKTTNLGIELPTTTTEDEGKILQVDSEGNWDKADAPIELPAVTSEDNGSVLKVLDGAWGKGEDKSAPEFVKFYENTLETDTNQISIPVESEYSEIIILYGIDPETGDVTTGERFPYTSTEFVVGLNNNTPKGIAPQNKTDIGIIHVINIGDSLYEINISISSNNTDTYIDRDKTIVQKAIGLSSIKIGLSSGNMKANASTFIVYGK